MLVVLVVVVVVIVPLLLLLRGHHAAFLPDGLHLPTSLSLTMMIGTTLQTLTLP